MQICSYASPIDRPVEDIKGKFARFMATERGPVTDKIFHVAHRALEFLTAIFAGYNIGLYSAGLFLRVIPANPYGIALLFTLTCVAVYALNKCVGNWIHNTLVTPRKLEEDDKYMDNILKSVDGRGFKNYPRMSTELIDFVNNAPRQKQLKANWALNDFDQLKNQTESLSVGFDKYHQPVICSVQNGQVNFYFRDVTGFTGNGFFKKEFFYWTKMSFWNLENNRPSHFESVSAQFEM